MSFPCKTTRYLNVFRGSVVVRALFDNKAEEEGQVDFGVVPSRFATDITPLHSTNVSHRYTPLASKFVHSFQYASIASVLFRVTGRTGC